MQAVGGDNICRGAVVCKLCTWVDSSTYNIHEDILPRNFQLLLPAHACLPGRMIGVEQALRRPTPHPIKLH